MCNSLGSSSDKIKEPPAFPGFNSYSPDHRDPSTLFTKQRVSIALKNLESNGLFQKNTDP